MENAAADRATLAAGQAHLRSELLTQAEMQAQAIKEQASAAMASRLQTEKTLPALQAQTAGIVEVVGQQRELVLAAIIE